MDRCIIRKTHMVTWIRYLLIDDTL